MLIFCCFAVVIVIGLITYARVQLMLLSSEIFN